jgi:hypothetical protein
MTGALIIFSALYSAISPRVQTQTTKNNFYFYHRLRNYQQYQKINFSTLSEPNQTKFWEH